MDTTRKVLKAKNEASPTEGPVRFGRGDVSGVACFVLAGGTGERLLPLTGSTPKPLLMYGGVYRLLDFTLSNVSNSGLPRAHVLTQYRKEDFGAYLRGYWNGTSGQGTVFVHQPPVGGKRYRGTADAVAANLEAVASGAESVLVLSADHVYRMDYRKMIERHRASGTDATVAVFPVPREGAREFGIVMTGSDGQVMDFLEKPSRPPDPGAGKPLLANMGVYVFDRKALEAAIATLGGSRPALDFGRDILPYLASRGRARAFSCDCEGGGYWRDLGTVDAYRASNMDLLGGELYQDLLNGQWPIVGSLGAAPEESAVRPDALPWRGSVVASSVPPGSCTIEESVVGPGVTISEGADVFGSILLPGAHIGPRARVRNAIVDTYASVRAGDEIGYSPSGDCRRFPRTASGVVVVRSGGGERTFAVNAAPASACPTR